MGVSVRQGLPLVLRHGHPKAERIHPRAVALSLILLTLGGRPVLATACIPYIGRRWPGPLALIDPTTAVSNVVGVPMRQRLSLLLRHIHPEPKCIHPRAVKAPKRLLTLSSRTVLTAARGAHMRRWRPSPLTLLDPTTTLPDIVVLSLSQRMTLLLGRIHPEQKRVHPRAITSALLLLTLRGRPVLTTPCSAHMRRRLRRPLQLPNPTTTLPDIVGVPVR